MAGYQINLQAGLCILLLLSASRGFGTAVFHRVASHKLISRRYTPLNAVYSWAVARAVKLAKIEIDSRVDVDILTSYLRIAGSCVTSVKLFGLMDTMWSILALMIVYCDNICEVYSSHCHLHEAFRYFLLKCSTKLHELYLQHCTGLPSVQWDGIRCPVLKVVAA